MPEKKSFLLRIAPEVYEAVATWASEELRSINGQVEFLLRRALLEAGRLRRQPGETRQRREQ